MPSAERWAISGRTRAQDMFDWRHIIKAYEDLWRELAQKRKAAPPKPGVPENWQAVHPAFPNPVANVRELSERDSRPRRPQRVVLNKEEIAALLKHEMNFFVPELLTPKESAA